MQNEKFLCSKDARNIFVISVVLGVINHFYFFTHEVMAPDALYFGTLSVAADWEASLGRWAIQYIDMARGGLVNPFLISIFCIACVAISSLILIEIFKIKSKGVCILLVLIMMWAPQMSTILMFTYTADSYALALLLSCVSIYILSKERQNVIDYIISMLCIIFALGLYQAYVGVMVGLSFLILIKRLIGDDELKDILVWFVKTMLFIFVCLILYYLYTSWYLKINDIDFASYKGADSLGIGLIFELPNTIKQAYLDLGSFLLGERILNNSIWNREKINIIIILLIAIKLVKVMWDKNIFKKPLRCLLLGMAFLLFPIGINLMDLIMPKTMINLVTGYGLILWYFILLILIDVSKSTINKFSKIAVLFLCWTFLISNNASYMARHDVYLNYYAEASRILTKVEELDGYSADMKWMFSDNIRYESKYATLGDGFISVDYMTWNVPEGIWMNQQFFDRYLGERITMVSYEIHNEILQSEEFLKMPVYPEKGSIKIIEDIVVIKFSETGSYVE